MRFGLGVLAYFVPTFARGFVWHLTRTYEGLGPITKDDLDDLRKSLGLAKGKPRRRFVPLSVR
jgi:hypothetical protein